MTVLTAVPGTAGTGSPPVPAARPRRIAAQGAAALAAAMGVGRFVYTPILPLMHAQAGLSPATGSALATANYAGYLLGALAGIASPGLARSTTALRMSLIVLTASLALMPATRDPAAWFAIRMVAGAASALVFIIAVTAVLTALHAHGSHLAGWAFGGVGAGIALSGAVVLALRGTGTWQQAWLLSAAVSLLLSIPACCLRTGTASSQSPAARSEPGREDIGGPRWFGALLISYILEGTGYIVAGTFLVAAIGQSAPAWVGSGAWVLAGLAGLPSAALWAWLSRRWSRPTLLIAALTVQGIGITLPVVAGGVGAALVSAVLFGGTFLGVAALVLAIGEHLRRPGAVAILTTGYSAGQVAGPLLVTPLLHDGYRQPLAAAAIIIVLAAGAAGALRYRFPRHLSPLPVREGAAARRTTTTRS